MDEQTTTAYERSVAEGQSRLHRSWPALLATGTVGGIDVSMGVLGFFLVETSTHNKVFAALAFGIDFIALTLAHSELFTENFLVPIAALTAKRAGIGSLVRLWVATAVVALHHVIIQSLTMFAALIYGAPFGCESWGADAGWAALGNIVGGDRSGDRTPAAPNGQGSHPRTAGGVLIAQV